MWKMQLYGFFSFNQSAIFDILYSPPLYFLHTPHWYITALTVACPCGIQFMYLIWDNVCEVTAWNNRSWNSLINNIVQCSFFCIYIGFFVSSGMFVAFVNLPWHLMILSSSSCKPSELTFIYDTLSCLKLYMEDPLFSSFLESFIIKPISSLLLCSCVMDKSVCPCCKT